MTKQDIKQKEKQLIEMTNEFCDEKLDEDYKQLCEKLIKKLGRKRDVPFQRGRLEIWAAAVIYALGTVNFLFDKSFEPFITTEGISEYFGTKNSTVSNRARQIREMLKMDRFGSDFSTQLMEKMNPFNDYVMVDGLVMPMDVLPPHLQEKVKEVRSRGGDIEFRTE